MLFCIFLCYFVLLCIIFCRILLIDTFFILFFLFYFIFVGTLPPSSNCSKCPAGSTSTQGATGCQLCEMGKYSQLSGSRSCTLCNEEIYEYSDTSGATTCSVSNLISDAIEQM